VVTKPGDDKFILVDDSTPVRTVRERRLVKRYKELRDLADSGAIELGDYVSDAKRDSLARFSALVAENESTGAYARFVDDWLARLDENEKIIDGFAGVDYTDLDTAELDTAARSLVDYMLDPNIPKVARLFRELTPDQQRVLRDSLDWLTVKAGTPEYLKLKEQVAMFHNGASEADIAFMNLDNEKVQTIKRVMAKTSQNEPLPRQVANAMKKITKARDDLIEFKRIAPGTLKISGRAGKLFGELKGKQSSRWFEFVQLTPEERRDLKTVVDICRVLHWYNSMSEAGRQNVKGKLGEVDRRKLQGLLEGTGDHAISGAMVSTFAAKLREINEEYEQERIPVGAETRENFKRFTDEFSSLNENDKLRTKLNADQLALIGRVAISVDELQMTRDDIEEMTKMFHSFDLLSELRGCEGGDVSIPSVGGEQFFENELRPHMNTRYFPFIQLSAGNWSFVERKVNACRLVYDSEYDGDGDGNG
jgi:hypothetical protein